MKNIKLLLLAAVTAFGLHSCKDEVEAPQTPYAAFETKSLIIGVDEAGEATKEVKVYTANVTESDRTINVSIDMDATTADPASYSVSPTVTIPAGSNEGILTIGFKDIELGVVNEDKTLKLKLEQTAEIFTIEELTVSLEQVCPNNGLKVKINLTFDSWPEEVYWRILDSNGAIVMASADPPAYGAYSGMSGDFTTPAECLDSGTYTLQIFDGYGDGGTAYIVTANGQNIFALGASDYGSFYSTTLTL